ncbi:hypothetical protein DTL42_18730 [Bremerella cremea]|uniref:Uncharacterized protein n=1 Tax=Bremerella cremea TaxID=1031537 RepID=A0A368KPP0_9BACT|nr:hypothetical protein [Bremerella cremea]RCS43533.1 hypothetical protein DTL42_18730 [Bremerella cremea]
MLRHLLAPLILITLLVGLGSYSGALQWSGWQVTASIRWQQVGDDLGFDVTMHRVYLQMPIAAFLGLLLVTVVVFTAISYFLFRRRANTQAADEA